MKKLLIATFGLIVILVGGYIVFQETIDRFNPLLTKEYVYVEITNPPKDDNGRFRYQLTGMNEDGDSKNVSFTSSTVLDEGTYLKVLAKGAYAEAWEMIKQEDLPVDL
ncbi:YxeA family protein [Bacillus sp. A116_S68]|nr:YxeA family protein [Bacillus sp. A116_S68]